jgi:hypothetical protein
MLFNFHGLPVRSLPQGPTRDHDADVMARRHDRCRPFQHLVNCISRFIRPNRKRETAVLLSSVSRACRCYDPERMLSIKVTKFPEGFPFPNAVRGMWPVIYFEAVSPRTTRVRIVGLGFGDDEESRKMRAFFDRGNAFTLKKLPRSDSPQRRQTSSLCRLLSQVMFRLLLKQ